MIHLTLAEIAATVMQKRGLETEFPEPVLREVDALKGPALPRETPYLRDMRDLLWISIDNDDSRDLDQLTYAEDGKLYVAVADVDALVKRGSSIDKHASLNTTSVYTPTKVFPMLPEKLSTDLTSLNENADRCAIVIEIDIGPEGKSELAGLYPAWVRNHAKLAYNGVGAWLEQKGLLPRAMPGLAEQLEIQDSLSRRLHSYRVRQGALSFGRFEIEPVIIGGVAVALKERTLNRAHRLIENAMVAANIAVTQYLSENKLPILRRVVRTPLRWDRIVQLARNLGESLPDQPNVKALRDFLLRQQHADPFHFPDLSLAVIKLIGRGEYVLGLPGEPSPGHFDLALRDYAHATAPNRRFPDLIVQRLVKNPIYGDSVYPIDELESLAAHCTQKEDDATKVERHMYKSAAAMVLTPKIGHTFKAMVTGASEKGTWVRLFAPPIEGKLVHGFQGLDVGDYVNVKLIHTDIPNAYIDFAKQ